MYKMLFAAISLLSIFATSKSFPQEIGNFPKPNSSLQVNGGIIMLFNISSGFTSSLQYNYPLNNKIDLYAYTGFSSWGKNSVSFKKEVWSSKDRREDFNSYSEDDHILIPLYLGVKLVSKEKYFTAFFNIETGYAYFGYNSFENHTVTDSSTGEIRAYKVVENSKKAASENQIGIGLGTGISSPITDNLDLVLAFKLNTTYKNPFGRNGTFYTLTAGIAYNL